ncbi:protein FAM117A-like isoform X1 [Acipenser ruthenus]|uniref:protein FAM117A-like isoform X1 n=1 Tax=Acipenser ruthenus TaxID=7906 RepID=UPI0027412C5C|nr:protein FAM117A-like isoform X1 [Acipenser ruthenus]
MSGRSGLGVVRGGGSGLQPLRATVPFQLHKQTNRESSRASTAGEKTKSCPPKPRIRRTLSLDTIVGPYLQGQWPRELEGHDLYLNDKATQTPSFWFEDSPGRKGSSTHKRSASWGSAEHLREFAKLKQQLQQRGKQSMRNGWERELHPPLPGDLSTAQAPSPPDPQTPMSRLTPRLRRSVEGLNLELEGVFVKQQAEKEISRILDIPDGHRAPVPPQRYSSGCQSESSPAPLSLSLSRSPSPGLGPVRDTAPDLDRDSGCPSPVLLLSSSPGPNNSYSFKREPPEGCERVRVCEETVPHCLGQAFLHSSCPDKNKVNFIPTGSAFCPVSLLKPLLPSMDFLFRSLSVSPSGGGASCQTGAAGGYLGPAM